MARGLPSASVTKDLLICMWIASKRHLDAWMGEESWMRWLVEKRLIYIYWHDLLLEPQGEQDAFAPAQTENLQHERAIQTNFASLENWNGNGSCHVVPTVEEICTRFHRDLLHPSSFSLCLNDRNSLWQVSPCARYQCFVPYCCSWMVQILQISRLLYRFYW